MAQLFSLGGLAAPEDFELVGGSVLVGLIAADEATFFRFQRVLPWLARAHEAEILGEFVTGPEVRHWLFDLILLWF